MKPLWQRLLVCYAALGVVFAAFVGRSPTLHVWVDHHGHASEHVHDKASRVTRSLHLHSHPHPHPHPHSAGGNVSAQASQASLLRDALEHRQKSVTLFGLAPRHIYGALAGLLTAALDQLPEPAEQGSHEHTHHTLSQLLLSGAIEQLLDVDPHLAAPERPEAPSPSPAPRVAAADWDAATATRGPPACC